jgi:hypothetical protein
LTQPHPQTKGATSPRESAQTAHDASRITQKHTVGRMNTIRAHNRVSPERPAASARSHRARSHRARSCLATPVSTTRACTTRAAETKHKHQPRLPHVGPATATAVGRAALRLGQHCCGQQPQPSRAAAAATVAISCLVPSPAGRCCSRSLRPACACANCTCQRRRTPSREVASRARASPPELRILSPTRLAVCPRGPHAAQRHKYHEGTGSTVRRSGDD